MAIPQDFACACLAPYELNRIRVAVGTITEVQIVNTMIGPMEAERGGGGVWGKQQQGHVTHCLECRLTELAAHYLTPYRSG